MEHVESEICLNVNFLRQVEYEIKPEELKFFIFFFTDFKKLFNFSILIRMSKSHLCVGINVIVDHLISSLRELFHSNIIIETCLLEFDTISFTSFFLYPTPC